MTYRTLVADSLVVIGGLRSSEKPTSPWRLPHMVVSMSQGPDMAPK